MKLELWNFGSNIFIIFVKDSHSLFFQKLAYVAKSIWLPFDIFWALCVDLSVQNAFKLKLKDRSTLSHSFFSKFAEFIKWQSIKVEEFQVFLIFLHLKYSYLISTFIAVQRINQNKQFCRQKKMYIYELSFEVVRDKLILSC